MNSLLPDIEGWIKLAGAAVAVFMAVLVPVRSWIVEDRRYRAQTLEAVAAASRGAVGGLAGTATALADSLAVARLADAIDRAARALERLAEGEGEAGDTAADVLDRLLAAAGPPPPRPARRGHAGPRLDDAG